MRTLDQDTDMRRMMGKLLPEPEDHMTAYGKGVMRAMQQVMTVNYCKTRILSLLYYTSF